MLPEAINYLDKVKSLLRLDPVMERQIIGELYTHFQERIAEQQKEGANEEEATIKAIDSFGRARVIARLMYEAYSKGSWTDALMTCLPHLLVASLLAFHFWQHYVLAPIVLSLVVIVTLYGWWHGKPNWLYSWIGYSLFPLLLVGYFSRFVPGQALSFLLRGEGTLPDLWLLILVLGFYALSAWIIVSTTIRVVKRDWILASLMLVPLPILGCWLFNIEQVGSVFQVSGSALHQWDGVMALSLLVLGLTSSIFIRLRQRVLKFGALVTFASIVLAIVAYNLWGDIGFFGMITFALFMLAFLFAPALLEARIGHGDQNKDFLWYDSNTA